MKKLKLIIKREYFNRIKKPSFLLLTLLLPFFITALILAPIAVNKSNFSQTKVIIFDNSQIIGDILAKHDQNKFVQYEVANENADLDEYIEQYDNSNEVMVLSIPENFIRNQAPVVELFNKNSPGLYVVSKVKSDLHDIRKKLLVYSTYKLDLQEFERRTSSPVSVIFQGEGLNPQMKFFIGLSASLLLYILIILYGVQVMRSVMEEKSSRIVEIIVSSVKPRTLLKGKIMGVGLVGITQFVIVALMSIAMLSVINSFFEVDTSSLLNQQLQLLDNHGNVIESDHIETASLFSVQIQNYIAAISNHLMIMLLVTPIIFFLGFYLYASLFASVGAAIDNETDTQQFVFPITIPLIISGSIAFSVLQNPNSDLAFWGSIIPFSSPIVLPARLVFMNLSEDWWELLLSISILLATTILFIRLSGRIYKTGILMYGQKVNYKTIWKWFKQKD